MPRQEEQATSFNKEAHTFDELPLLPPGSRVAVVTMLGTLCPVTKGHIEMFTEAKNLLITRQPAFASCVGFISLNDGAYVDTKLKAKGDEPLSKTQRRTLVDMAILEIKWLRSCGGRHETELEAMRRQYPTLVFEHYEMNGADDVVRYRKWQEALFAQETGKRYITMGRHGSMEALHQGMHEDGISESEYFLLGPEIAIISSSDARAACKQGDLEALQKMLVEFLKSHLIVLLYASTIALTLKNSGSTPRWLSGTLHTAGRNTLKNQHYYADF